MELAIEMPLSNMTSHNDVRICSTCAVENTSESEECAICADARQYVPNHLPLSGTVVERIAKSVNRFSFDRLYGNFDNVIESGAKGVVRQSADRHIAWINGEFDDLTSTCKAASGANADLF